MLGISKKRAFLSTAKGKKLCKDIGHILQIQAEIWEFLPAVDTRTLASLFTTIVHKRTGFVSGLFLCPEDEDSNPYYPAIVYSVHFPFMLCLDRDENSELSM